MSSTPVEIGTLIAVILKAKNLPNKRHIGKQDPYCTISLNGEKRRTRAVKRGGQHPEWDEEVRFSLLEDDDEDSTRSINAGDAPPPLPPKNGKGPKQIKGGILMKLQCFADDPREPDLIGETMVDLTEALTKGETDEWFTLMNKDKYCGEVYLELTFWSNERPPEKKVTPKPSKINKQYSGPGTFVPSEEIPSSLTSGSGSRSSRIPSSNGTFDTDPQDSVPASLRSSLSSAKLDLYTAPYEQRGRYSPVDRIANDFGELNVSDHRRRESYPPVQSHTPRPFTSMGTHPSHAFEPSSYSDAGSQFGYDVPPTPTQSQHQGTVSGGPPNPFAGQASYQHQYETGPPPSNYNLPPRNGPRYSLPATSSGFMPIAAPSGFMIHQPDHSGYASPPPPTPGPISYGTAQMPPQSSFAPMPTQTPGPSGFISPMQSSPSSFNQGQQYLPPAQPSFQYQQYDYVPQPPASAPSMQYASPPPPQSVPPQQYLAPQPPASVPPQSHSAPPQTYSGYGSSTPLPHDFVPPPPPPPLPNNSLSASQGTGSRPLPAQPLQYAQQPPQHQSSLPLPPSGQQSYSPPQQGVVAFPTGNGYNLVPPPPPPPLALPQMGGRERAKSQSYRPPQTPIPPPPPPPPLSQFHSSSPSGRPSLPQPPIAYHQQQPVYQPVPPPPPPPNFGQHQYAPPLPDSPQPYYQPPQSQWMPQMPNSNYSQV